MLMEARTGGTDHNMTRKPRWSFKKAVWLAFHDDCETAFAEAGPEHGSVQELATLADPESGFQTQREGHTSQKVS